jgi:hypothetical protein
MMDEHTPCTCDICKVRRFERNHYYHGKMLSARDLADEQKYFNEKRWLINRAILGWGIVCGLDVSLDPSCLVVEPGLALDCCGHEILVCERLTLSLETFQRALGGDRPVDGAQGRPQTQYQGQTPPSSVRWVVCLEYKERCTEPVKPVGGCSSKNGSEYNRIQDDYALTVREWDKACPDNHDDVCCPVAGLGSKTSLHHALTERSKKCPHCKDCACVVLATGTFDGSAQPPTVTLDPDSWKYRRLVYTNPALASVIRCFHSGLPHISWINWPPDTQFKVDDFINRLKDNLQVQFDQPMRVRTVTNLRSCRLSIFFATSDNYCPVQMLIPVHRIDYDENTRVATYCFDNECIEQELRKVCRKLRKPADVELILHGSVIHNEHGRALDAELIDGFPTGNGVEAGEFIAYYTVAP